MNIIDLINNDKIIKQVTDDNNKQIIEIMNDSYPIVEATGTNNYVGTSVRIKTTGKGTRCTLFIETDATGNCSLNLNDTGVVAIKDSFGKVITDLKAGVPYNLCHNGKDFILQGKGGGGNTNGSISGSTIHGVSTAQIITLPFIPKFIICKNHNGSNFTFISQKIISFFMNQVNESNTIMIVSENSISPSTTNVVWDGNTSLTITNFSTNPVEYYDYWAFE